MSSGSACRRIIPILLVAAVVVAGCAQAAPIAGRLGGMLPAASAGASGLEPGSAIVDGAMPSVAPSAGPTNWATAGEPGTRASLPPVRTAGADWPAAARTTPDPWFTLHVPVLMYHRIVALADAGAALPGLVVDPAVFAQQMGLLASAGWRTITLATLQLDLATGRQLPPRTFVITIDDGHVDGLTNALPILRRFGFVATFFVVMGRIHESPYLNAADLRTLADAGMEIADHTMAHRDVARLHGAALDFQIGAAAAAIEQITGRAPTTFAYPAGEWSLEAVAVVQAHDLGMAVTTREGVLETWANRFLVPRLRISRSVTPGMLLRLLSGYAVD
jgi:peptidoglycan/xylan/chitin deacetylase (PgdA/CDA1 family)